MLLKEGVSLDTDDGLLLEEGVSLGTDDGLLLKEGVSIDTDDGCYFLVGNAALLSSSFSSVARKLTC
jgi:hypothetical protein